MRSFVKNCAITLTHLTTSSHRHIHTSRFISQIHPAQEDRRPEVYRHAPDGSCDDTRMVNDAPTSQEPKVEMTEHDHVTDPQTMNDAPTSPESQVARSG